MKGNSGKDLL